MQSGAIVAERFRLERELGRGGMGSVWRAHHLRLDIPCAIKFIHGDESSMPELRARFEREARAAAKLRSPNVVQMLDHGEWEGTPYLVMELLEGEDLAHRLERLGQLPPGQLVSVLRDVGRALDRAHALGIVHRDLKPDNIFLVRDGDREVAKVVDFGIAKVDGLSLGDARTKTGSLLGTPYYMSPEQAEGTRPIDARSDLWALGVIAFECVTGRVPFDGESLGDLLMKIMVRPIPVPSQIASGVPQGFDAFWERASKRDPAERFQSASELVSALAASFGMRVADEQVGRADEPPPVSARAPLSGAESSTSSSSEHERTASTSSLGTMDTIVASASQGPSRGTLAEFANTSSTAGRSAEPTSGRRTALVATSVLAVAAIVGLGVVFGRSGTTSSRAGATSPESSAPPSVASSALVEPSAPSGPAVTVQPAPTPATAGAPASSSPTTTSPTAVPSASAPTADPPPMGGPSNGSPTSRSAPTNAPPSPPKPAAPTATTPPKAPSTPDFGF
jgi:serine/threonine protein kinase